MSGTRTLATGSRVLNQLRNDHRTVALILVVPCVLMGLLAWIITAADFDQYGPPLLGIFPLIIMFLTTSITTLRERRSGTLERLLSMPIAKTDFVFGYAIAFGLLATVQAAQKLEGGAASETDILSNVPNSANKPNDNT
jgi:ABC-2 type transport system permease protein